MQISRRTHQRLGNHFAAWSLRPVYVVQCKTFGLLKQVLKVNGELTQGQKFYLSNFRALPNQRCAYIKEMRNIIAMMLWLKRKGPKT